MESLPTDVMDRLVCEVPQLALCSRQLMQKYAGLLSAIRTVYMTPSSPCPVAYVLYPGGFYASMWEELLKRAEQRGCSEVVYRFFARKHDEYMQNGPRAQVLCAAAVRYDIIERVLNEIALH